MSSRLLRLLVAYFIFLSLAFHHSYPTHTRKRRYLAFPDKSNLAITITLLKPTAFMNGVNTLHEIDLGVPLPKNPHRLIRRRDTDGTHSQGSWERQVLYGQIEAALDICGENQGASQASLILYIWRSLAAKAVSSMFGLHDKDNKIPLFQSSIRHLGLLYIGRQGKESSLFSMYGLNGAGCLERVMCEVQQLKDEHLKKSVVLDLLKTIFTLPGLNFTKKFNCYKSCEFSIFHPSLMMQK